MAITIVNDFPLQLLKKQHDFDNDTFKCALYTSSATLDEDTTVYSASDEIGTAGYTAGGVTIAVSTGYPQLELINGKYHSSVRFDDAVFSLTANTPDVRYALIYNDTNASKFAVVILDYVTAINAASGSITISMPLAQRPIVHIKPGQEIG